MVNVQMTASRELSDGGWKQSGYGRNLGAPTVAEFTHLKSIWLAR